MEGPFYPVLPIPLRTDLILDTESIAGEAMLLTGKVVNQHNQPLTGVKVEIWQCDAKGLYDHPRQPHTERFDSGFSGAGATLTDEYGDYQFHTLYPVPYTGRPPHIHVKLWRSAQELLTTQLYLRGQSTSNEWFDRGREHLQIAPEKDTQQQLTATFKFVVTG